MCTSGYIKKFWHRINLNVKIQETRRPTKSKVDRPVTDVSRQTDESKNISFLQTANVGDNN